MPRTPVSCTLLPLVFGCAADPEPRLLGRWFEPVTGEPVTLHEDGRVDWFGESGSYEFERVSNILCNIAVSGCPDGEVSFDLPGESFRMAFRGADLDREEEVWTSALRNYGGSLARWTHGDWEFDLVTLLREAYGPRPYAIDGWARMDAGLESEGLHHAVGQMRKVDGQLIRKTMRLVVWHGLRWEERSLPTSDTSGLHLGSEHLYHQDGWSSEDAGETWSDVPPTDVILVPDGSSLSQPWLLNNQVLVTRTQWDSGHVTILAEPEILALDLSAPDDGWQTVGSMPLPTQPTHINELGVHESTGTLVAREYDASIRISIDLGQHWTLIEDSEHHCQDTWPGLYSAGIYCEDVSGSDVVLHAYDLTEQRWLTFDALAEGLNVSSVLGTPESSGFTLQDGNTLWHLDEQMTLRKLVDLPTAYQAHAQVFETETVVSQFTLWHLEGP